ncbi:MAG TPA: hypothetical protein VF245_02155 [Solirubrobacterales bacterium]
MHRIAAPFLAVALAAMASFAFAACGGEGAKLLPGATAAEISENLDTVQQLASEGECVGAADAADQVSAQIEALNGVDPKLKQALERGAARLDEVVSTCEESETEVEPPTDQAEEEEKLPPGQAKKEEKEREKEERELEKEEEKAETQVPPEKESPSSEEATPPPSEGGGTGAPGGVSPATPAPEDE